MEKTICLYLDKPENLRTGRLSKSEWIIFLFLQLTAGTEIVRTTYQELIMKTGMSINAIRDAIEKLKLSGCIWELSVKERGVMMFETAPPQSRRRDAIKVRIPFSEMYFQRYSGLIRISVVAWYVYLLYLSMSDALYNAYVKHNQVMDMLAINKEEYFSSVRILIAEKFIVPARIFMPYSDRCIYKILLPPEGIYGKGENMS